MQEKAPPPTDGSDAERNDAVAAAVVVAPAAQEVYSIFNRTEKIFIIMIAAWAAFFSPVSANIYFPALGVLADDLQVSSTLINLTITSYMVGNRFLCFFLRGW